VNSVPPNKSVCLPAKHGLLKVSGVTKGGKGGHPVTKQGGQGDTSASGRSTLGAPNWSRNVTY